MQKYNCKTCGAELFWDAQEGALKCEYCGSKFSIEDFEDETLTVSEEVDTAKEKEYTNIETDEDNVVYECSNCGAEVITTKTTIATTCAFCGRALSISNKAAGVFRPDKIVPFQIPKEKATETYKKYIRSSILIPNCFKTEMTIKKMQGLYVPFHTHSATADSHVSISAERTSSRRSGDDKIVTHKIYNINMDVSAEFKNVPADASKKMDNDLMDSIEPYDYKNFSDFNPAYMAGYFAEQSDETFDSTRMRTNEKINDSLKAKALAEIVGYTSKSITSYDPNIVNTKEEYTMLPIWLLNVEYEGKMYTFAINGQTGKAVGKLPISKLKLLGCGAISMFVCQLIMIIINLL